MTTIEMISMVANILLGSGFIASIITIRAQRKKAGAEADNAAALVKTTELDNVQEAIKIWREMAEGLKLELEGYKNSHGEMTKEVDALRKEVQKLTAINGKILKLLDKLTPENMEEIKTKIKEIHEGN